MSRKDARIITRRKVIESATAMFADRGYEATSIRDLAAHMGMSTGAVFAHFASKSDLYAEIYGHPPISAETGRELAKRLVGAGGIGILVSEMQDDPKIQPKGA